MGTDDIEAIAQRIAELVSTQEKKRLYSVQETAEYLGVEPCTVRKLQRTAQLPRVEVGSRVFCDIHDLDVFIERSKQ